MKKIIVLVVLALGIVSSAQAQGGPSSVTPSLAMLKDPAALREYALAKVVRGTRYVWAESLD